MTKKKLRVYEPAQVKRRRKVIEYMEDYVQKGLSINQIADKYGITTNVLELHRAKGKWVLQRQLYMENHGLTMIDLMVIARNDERGEMWKKYGEVVMGMMNRVGKELEDKQVTTHDAVQSMETLGRALERAFKGERLEKGQATSIEKQRVGEDHKEAPKLLNIMIDDPVEIQETTQVDMEDRGDDSGLSEGLNDGGE
jgi:predicted DNA-binding protein YlxM (UPF0122 family)